MLTIFSSPPFYTTYVRLPTAEDPSPSEIRDNPKLWPFFKDALGAIDGSHIHCAPPAIDRASYRNRKGFCSQNCLFACNFSLQFVYSLTEWEGSATDARVFEDACQHDLQIPATKYYLADAGFPLCDRLLVPYRGVRYHLAEWGRANVWCVTSMTVSILLTSVARPRNMQELFNLRHASARNVIERIFGVLKRRFRILLLAPEYGLRIQAQIPSALSAIHNFICIHDRDEGPLLEERDLHDRIGYILGDMDLAVEDDREATEMRDKRDRIAEAMWEDYQSILEGQDNRVADEDMEEDDDELFNDVYS
jgi:hypothetical protein